MISNVLTFLVLSTLSLAGEARSYTYLAKRVPNYGWTNCHEQARNLSERFSQLTGLIAQGTCQETHKDGSDFLIRYEATGPLNVVSSVPDLDFPSRGYEFGTKKQCEAEITKERMAFQEVIGKEPLLAFCRSQANYHGLRRWALILEGFGQTKLKLAWSTSLFPGQPGPRQIEEVKKSVYEKLNREGVNVRFVFIQKDDRGHLRISMLYYGQYHEQLKGYSLALVNSLDDCLEALNDFETIDATNPQISSIAYCVDNSYRRGADLFVVFNILNWYQLKKSAETFSSYLECQAARKGLVDLYKNQVSSNYLGGFCSEWGSNWKVNFLALPSTP